ncbi:hypothetical protein [Dyadobacter frigoris]|uniref:Outer membrane protein beta-barrel domain-containing protein n=1 Tax=Dyadobacter frigoris TaxID=2576211 RepID=A0A4U6D9B6_9BACT|nr:hypothetical protein [Dyadobacter frigoris]TKT94100.1 hypothetical protein FDK13_02500 [Dyadobacter frigoris]GLU50689.1 hypothetical protein Dfri01_01500 [Dyadobacter frigoris]
MKKSVLLIIMSLVSLCGNAQEAIEDSKLVYIGLDLVKSLPSYVFPDKYLIRNTVIIEPYVIFPGKDPRKHWVLSGGFAQGTSKIDTTQISQSQKFQGVYIKMAFENQYKRIPLRFGYGPIISFSGFRGKYTFKGPTFGDYTGSFTDDQNFAFGAEAYLAYDLKLNKKLMLRFQIRTTMAVRMSGNISPDYFPGVGITKGLNSFLISPGFSTQLFYKVH